MFASKGERRGMWSTGILPSLKLNVHSAQCLGIGSLPFLYSVDFLAQTPPRAARACTGPRGKEGRRWRAGKEEAATSASQQKTWKKQFKALLHTTVATGYHSSLPFPLLMPLCHTLVLSQSLAKTRITGESSHTLKIHFL